jgi:hypothetical protein
VTLGSHQTTVGKSQVHLTPKWIIEALGPFDLDPCAANPRPWDCAFENYSKTQDGLSLPWSGVVWLNPPFDRYKVGLWVEKLAAHGDGIAFATCQNRNRVVQALLAAGLCDFVSRQAHQVQPPGWVRTSCQ